MIIALTGARLSEVTGMQVTDVVERFGMQTFFLAKERGKTEDSQRITRPKARPRIGVPPLHRDPAEEVSAVRRDQRQGHVADVLALAC